MPFKLGRQARTFDAAIPHVATLKRAMAAPLPPLPVAVNNAARLPPNVGMFANDRVGCCTCAGMGHLIQLWSQDAEGAERSVTDAQVLQAYREVAGYDGVPGDASDRGAVEQDVLHYWQNVGFPLAEGRLKVGAVYEVNPRDLAGLCEVIMEFGAAYVGFEVPSGFMDDLPPLLWEDRPEYGEIEGGHCVLLHSFDRTDPANPIFGVTSWGTNRKYRMAASFVRRYLDEAYGIVSSLWIDKSGKTPYGLDLAALEALGGRVGKLEASTSATGVDHGAEVAAAHGVARSVHWPTVEREYKKANPVCAAGGRGPIQVHHVHEFHKIVHPKIGRKDLEFDARNFIGLTEGPDEDVDGEYHLVLGHRGNFQHNNDGVRDSVVQFHGQRCADIKKSVEWLAIVPSQKVPEMSDADFEAYRLKLNAELPPDPALLARFGFRVDERGFVS